MKNILITGIAGFIGFHLAINLLKLGYKVVGIDNINNYYDTNLKSDRLQEIDKFVNKHHIKNQYKFIKMNLEDKNSLSEIFLENRFDVVINLAAQAGVRYSIENPDSYISSNINGFVNILEVCKENSIKHLIFASSSSVYGLNTNQPFSVEDKTDWPVSLYAATKKSNELLAHSYSHINDLPCTGLRFFTVYGPYGRPDMAYFSFTESIINNKPIKVFNNGHMKRDFTYIDDIVDGITRCIPSIPSRLDCKETNSNAPFKIYNIGNNNPVSLDEFIKSIESALNVSAKKIFMPMQDGDVPITFADIDDIKNELGFNPTTPIDKGIKEFVEWYINYYEDKKNERK